MLSSVITAITAPSHTTGVQIDWAEFYAGQFDRVYRLILRSGVPASEAEDLAQQTFLILHRRVQAGTLVENPAGWVHGVALKVVADYYRWRRVRKLKSWLLPWLPGAVPGESSSPEQNAAQTQAQEQICAVLGRMSPKLRATFVLLEVEQMSLTDAAGVLEIPVNTLRSRRRLAQDAFRQHHAAVFGQDADGRGAS